MPFDGVVKPTDLSGNAQPIGFFGRIWKDLIGNPGDVMPPQPLVWPEAPLPNSPSEVLRLARRMIENRQGWVRCRYETEDGRYCAVGALRAVGRKHTGIDPSVIKTAKVVLQFVAYCHGHKDIETMNDTSSHRRVLSAFDEAIARARNAYP